MTLTQAIDRAAKTQYGVRIVTPAHTIPVIVARVREIAQATGLTLFETPTDRGVDLVAFTPEATSRWQLGVIAERPSPGQAARWRPAPNRRL